MKNATIKVLTILFTVLSFTAKSQTNVSGGIYANTTWALANSPYIVVDTVVVFPGVTLTIQPGVTVKFADGKYMEIRQGTFVAAGTVTDSITFTSNSATPSIGIYNGIVFNTAATTIDYCIFKYAANALNLSSFSLDTSVIQHSYFYMNNTCIPSHSNVVIKQSSFYNNNSCIPNPSFINIKQSSFYNNTECLGYPIGGGWVNKSFLDSCTFINNTFVEYLGQYSQVTNGIFLNNSTVFRIRGGLPGENHLWKNCVFCNNQSCIFMLGPSFGNNDRLINCNFSNNGIALQSQFSYMTGNVLANNDTAAFFGLLPTDSVFNNYIFHNQVGILYSGGTSAAFFNNYICNNTLYNINYTSPYNGSIPPVCFCDTDSAAIRSKIYDGYVNIARGLLNFTPFVNCDSSAITALPPLNCQTVIFTQVDAIPNQLAGEILESYPNPASDHITLNLSKDISKAQLKIFNILGELKYSSAISSQKTNLDISRLSNGVYFLEVYTENKISRQKFIKQ